MDLRELFFPEHPNEDVRQAFLQSNAETGEEDFQAWEAQMDDIELGYM